MLGGGERAVLAQRGEDGGELGCVLARVEHEAETEVAGIEREDGLEGREARGGRRVREAEHL